MAEKVNKIDSSSIKLYGPIPRTIGTLLTVLVVTASFGVIGWRQLQSSHAETVASTSQVSSDHISVAASDYTVSADAQSTRSTYPNNFHSRLMFFGALIIATLALLFLLKLWT